MSSIPSTSSTSGTSSTDNSAALNTAFASLGPADFLKMMLAELQNQSPLDPTNTSDMLNQLSTLSQVSSSQSLTSTLNSVLLGSNLTSSSYLIGATVSGLSDASQQITGVVNSVTIDGGEPKLNIGSDTMSLSNVEDIFPPGTSATGATSASSTDSGSTDSGSTGDGSSGSSS